jgi:hypothetical protein
LAIDELFWGGSGYCDWGQFFVKVAVETVEGVGRSPNNRVLATLGAFQYLP